MSQNCLKIYSSLTYVPYGAAVLYMQDYVAQMLLGKTEPCLWFLEHPPLYTAGMSAQLSDILRRDIAPLYKTNRGGQVTYHGPGQQVVYVMMPLAPFQKDVRAYVKFLEEWLIATVEDFGVEAFRMPGKIGIWVNHQGQTKKIAAIGVRVKKWISYHGVALNNTVNLDAFKAIIPCGIQDLGVTSLKEMGASVTAEELQEKLELNFRCLYSALLT